MVVNAVTIFAFSTFNVGVLNKFNNQSKRYEDIGTTRQSKITNGLGNVVYGTARIRTVRYFYIQCRIVRAQ